MIDRDRRNRWHRMYTSMFARGFQRGEHDAFVDRRAGRCREAPDINGEALRGWLAGYTPRDPAWYQLPPLPQETAHGAA